MKRLISIALAAVMLVSCFALADFSALAFTRKKAPEYKVGDKFTITLNVKDKDGNGGVSSKWKNAYYAKFKPESDGDYEFSVKGVDFYGTGGYRALLVDAKDKPVSFAYATGDDSFYVDLVGHLKANRTYYYLVQYQCDYTHSVKLSVKLKKHKHQMINTATQYPDASYMIDAVDENGNPIDMCKVQGCYDSGLSQYYEGGYEIVPRKAKYLYTGSEIKPEIKYIDRRGNEFSPDLLSDDHKFKIKYKDNVNVGVGKIMLWDEYEWIPIKFTILPAKTKISMLASKKRSASVKWNIVKAQASGYQVEYSRDKNFKKGSAKRVKVSGRKSSSLNINYLSSGRKYYFRVRTYKKVGKKTYYSPWSAAESVKIK